MAATCIIDNLCNSGRLGSDSASDKWPKYPEGSLEQQPKVKPRIVKPKQRVDWAKDSESQAEFDVEDMLEDKEGIPGLSNVVVEDILLSSIYEVQESNGNYTYTPPQREMPDASGWDQTNKQMSLTAPSPNA